MVIGRRIKRQLQESAISGCYCAIPETFDVLWWNDTLDKANCVQQLLYRLKKNWTIATDLRISQCETSLWCDTSFLHKLMHRGADKSLARSGRKQVNVCVRMSWISFSALPCKEKKKLDDSSRLDVVEIARVPDMLPGLFPSWTGKGLNSTPVILVVKD